MTGVSMGIDKLNQYRVGLRSYMEKRCPGQEGHPPSRVNFTERLYEKKVDPFARVNS